ncbi:MAG: DUF3515 domain-containing protein [Gordonia amarae]
MNDSGSEQPDDGPVSEGGSASTLGPEKSGPAVTSHDREPRRLSPALVATLIAIPVMVLTFFVVVAALKPDGESNPVESLAAPQSDSPDCAKLVAALPERFDGFSDKKTGDGIVRYTGDDGDIVVRCGVERPKDLAPTSALQVVNPVQWFMTDTREGSGQAYVAVDRRPYVALWLPIIAGNAPITDVSTAISKALPVAPLEFG